MLINAVEGIVQNGKIHLRDAVSLPENARVYVIIANEQVDQLAHADDREARIRSPRLARAEQSKDFAKQVVELPSDAKL